jgi:Mlc titration factor MtfA (ptsG expression regulator)
MTVVILILMMLFLNGYLARLDKNGPEKTKGLGFRRHRKSIEALPFDHISHELLVRYVEFYVRLPNHHQIQFRKDAAWFLSNTRIVGEGWEVDQLSEHLVAASAIIPIFHFEEWNSYELDEVLLLRSSFNFNLETDKDDSLILGMVGTGVLEGKMILSAEALHEGFINPGDMHNVGIHEFVHLLDKADGRIDGLPKSLISHSYSLPWIQLIRYKMELTRQGQTEINPYGGLNLAEFLSITSEYFFENPEGFRKNHPELFEQMDKMFRGKLKEMPAA